MDAPGGAGTAPGDAGTAPGGAGAAPGQQQGAPDRQGRRGPGRDQVPVFDMRNPRNPYGDHVPSRCTPLDLRERWGPTDVWGRAVHGVLVPPLDNDWRYHYNWDAIPQPPPYDPLGPGGALAASAMERLRDLGDPQYEALLFQEQLRLYRWSTEEWATLRDTFDIKLWIEPLCDHLGMDEQNVLSLMCLVAQGSPGRVEANRLMWQFLKPCAHGSYGFHKRSEVYQKAIRNA